MRTWAFILKSPSCAEKPLRTEIEYGERRLLILGADTVEKACGLAKWAVEEKGCWLIELCGGFHKDGAQKIIEAVRGKVPVGHVEFLPEELVKLERMR